MSDIKEVTEKLLEFRKDRKWEEFHNPKDLAVSLMLEAAEVPEHFQWKSPEEIKEYIKNQDEKRSIKIVFIYRMFKLDYSIKQCLIYYKF